VGNNKEKAADKSAAFHVTDHSSFLCIHNNQMRLAFSCCERRVR
jgi:hypothetical protein